MIIRVRYLRRPKETVEVLTLQEFLFPHKAFQRLSPALPQNLKKERDTFKKNLQQALHLNPLQVNLTDIDGRQLLRSFSSSL